LRLKSPLTSIIGSVELLKAKGRDDDELSAKYHDLILRSANRIKDLTEEEVTAAVEAEERAPELVIG
jgi:signal transduction histidine kinase